jgi:pyruvate dehydrogenase E2 component (dihydrolipoamide acetyltransferase)
VSADGPRGETTILEPTPAERTVARRVSESRATVPSLELTVALDRAGPVATPRLLSACAHALAEHPRANAAYRDGHFELYSRVNIGLVLALDQAYLIPTVFDAAAKAPAELDQEVSELRRRALAGELTAAAFSGATFTVWNAGELELTQAALPVVPPQAGALAAGTEALTLSCDHRILYGAPAASFLRAVIRRLAPGDR